MKQLFFIFSFFVAVSARAQTQYIAAPNTTLEVRGPLVAKKVLEDSTANAMPVVIDPATGRFARRTLGIVVKYPLMGSAGSTVNVKDTQFIDPVKVARWDSAAEFTEHFSESVGVTHQELEDSTNNLKTAINNVLANFSNYYTKTESDARFYPLDLNPKGYLTAVPATDDPYRIDSSKILGEDNPRTLTNYYHNGSTSSTNYIDFKSDYWRKNASGDLYHLETNGTGFVGIGTNAPAASIHVAANYTTGSIPGFLLTDKTAPGGFLKLMDGTGVAGSYNPIIYGKSIRPIDIGDGFGIELLGEPSYDSVINAGVNIENRLDGATITKAQLLRVSNNEVEKFSIGPTGIIKSVPLAGTGVRTVVANPDGSLSTGTGSGGTDAQTLSISGNSLSISGGNTVTLPTSSYTPTIATSSATALTLATTTETYVFTGSSAATWTLPAVSGNTALRFFLKNRGSTTVLLQRAGSDQLYFSSAVTSITLYPGDAYTVQNDGTFWIIM